ncbi:E3 binding domain-containing protein [Deinococcus aluminii]|uniref:Peripheral subunit-binding (PSBD) domain-containing protein n=1 Tax=Deinococcus aluminii TaxID=1656885 RepID=A0ABP9XF83_9DEIO
MERIAPLAKILAEANGIDWRNLPGSGEGGMIVEQDILNYLTRVMSGEEEPPSTPVDAPPPEWTGTDLPAGAGLLAPGMPSMDMLSSAGVDSDLAALVGQPQPAPPAPASLDDDALEFELEDDQADVPAFAAPVPGPEEAAPPAVASSAPEVVPAAPALGREEQSAPAEQAPGLAAVAQPEPVAARGEAAPPPPAAPAGGGVMAGLGNLLSRLYQQPTTPPPTPAAPEMPAAAQTPAPEVAAPVAEVPAPEVHPVPEVEEVPAPAAVTEPAPTPAEDEVQPAPQVTEAEEPAPEPAAAPTEAAPTEPEAVAPVPVPLPAAGHPREAVWFGTYLRRDANIVPAAELRRQLVSALGQDVPLALLVARAAQRHADSLGLGTVAVQDLDASRARTVQPGGLRDALAALGTDQEGTPDLLVIDAGALDLDDLHLPHTVTLSVGRVQEGRAALTLNGDVDPAQAARFLANVAGTLEEPIILVV